MFNNTYVQQSQLPYWYHYQQVQQYVIARKKTGIQQVRYIPGTLHVVRRPCQSWLGFLAGGVCLTPLVTRRLTPCPTLGCLSSLSFSSLSLDTASSRLLFIAHHGVLERLEVRPYVEHLGIPSSVSRGNQERADRQAK